MKTLKTFAILSISLMILSGCSVKPWVKPYERQNLADAVMKFDRDPASSKYLHHVYESREAMRGAEGSSGGGCGCN
ncbi:MAG: DUF4266 domain-containing protein [Cellvibrionaceae bacterium]